jgi:hypothetical protein
MKPSKIKFRYSSWGKQHLKKMLLKRNLQLIVPKKKDN